MRWSFAPSDGCCFDLSFATRIGAERMLGSWQAMRDKSTPSGFRRRENDRLRFHSDTLSDIVSLNISLGAPVRIDGKECAGYRAEEAEHAQGIDE